jgi:putative hydrolase of the HAD superfamily
LIIGLISNTGITPGYVLRGLLADYGLLPYFRILTFSDEARLAKPAEEIFRCTLEALEVQAAEAVFVGDMPELDVVGPQAVRMWAVQVGDRQLDGVRPHARIDGLPELFPALERLGLVGG